jgi:hypothetical protein
LFYSPTEDWLVTFIVARRLNYCQKFQQDRLHLASFLHHRRFIYLIGFRRPAWSLVKFLEDFPSGSHGRLFWLSTAMTSRLNRFLDLLTMPTNSLYRTPVVDLQVSPFRICFTSPNEYVDWLVLNNGIIQNVTNNVWQDPRSYSRPLMFPLLHCSLSPFEILYSQL